MTSEFTVAVHALVFMNHEGTFLSSEGLAENICTNPARVRKVMAKLKQAGLVETKEGVDGGYHFIRPAEDTTLYMVAEAMEFSFVSTGWKSGDTHKECLIASGMGDVMEGIYSDLNQACLERLKGITIADIDQKIFRG